MLISLTFLMRKRFPQGVISICLERHCISTRNCTYNGKGKNTFLDEQ